jgi:tetratricopeptide (TPR) repeat protein
MKTVRFSPLLLVTIFLALFLGVVSAALTPTQGSIPLPSEERDDFILGEYYFNQIPSDYPYDAEKAKYHYEQFLANGGEHLFVHYQLGRLYFIEGDFGRALKELDTQYEKYGNELPNVHYMLGLTYGYKARMYGDKEDWHKAEQSFQEFIRLMPTAPWSRVDLAWVYFSQGKFVEITPLVTEGLVYAPSNPWLHNMYGLALLNTGEKELAHEHFLKAQEFAKPLTTEDWGRSYPGNDPRLWEMGLKEFRTLIDTNVALSAGE